MTMSYFKQSNKCNNYQTLQTILSINMRKLAEHYDIDLEGIMEMTTDKFKEHFSEIVTLASRTDGPQM